MHKPIKRFSLTLITGLLIALLVSGCGDSPGALAIPTPTTSTSAASTVSLTTAVTTVVDDTATTAPALTTVSVPAQTPAATSPSPTVPITFRIIPAGNPTSTPLPITTSFSTTPASGITSATAAVASSPGQVTYVFDRSLPETDQAQIKLGVEMAEKALGPVGPFKVKAGDSLKLVGGKDTYAVTTLGEIEVYTRYKPWREASHYDRVSTLVHEYYHLVQYYLTKLGDEEYESPVPPDGPVWLSEGSAEYMSYRVVADNGLVKYEQVRAEKVSSAEDYSYKLKEIETDESKKTSENGEYVLGFLGVEYLVKNYGGTQALTNYYSAISTGLTWQSAFKKAFGISLDLFYQKFEAYRQAGY